MYVDQISSIVTDTGEVGAKRISGLFCGRTTVHNVECSGLFLDFVISSSMGFTAVSFLK